MNGLMQDRPLLISSLIEFAKRNNGDVEIVSRFAQGKTHRTTWAGVARRCRQVANAIEDEHLLLSERIGTLAWNGYRHLELYYGVSGSGRVLHTINPRLSVEQIAWIMNHAEDKIVCFDIDFLSIIQAVHDKGHSVRKWVALCSADQLPADHGVSNLVCYEDWIGNQIDTYSWPELNENTAAALCYTSGTTGNPKGVLYSHRSTVLHAYASALPDMMNLSVRDSVLPVVPMFHVNAWGIPYSAALVGCKLVLPGPALDGASIFSLIEEEAVTFAAGVPTVWQMLIAHMRLKNLRFSTLKRTLIGGAACPPAILRAFQEDYGVRVLHGWGMTEMSPIGTVCSLKKKHDELSADLQTNVLAKQGRAVYGVEMKIIDGDGSEMPWDGRSSGDLLVRGPWVAQSYFKEEGGNPLIDGWFPTGDVATIDADGYLQITDRSKDLVKSGGEWISSIDIENIAVAHPAVAMAACIGVSHPKWDERPIVIVTRKQGAELSRAELLAFFEGKAAKWQIPDDVIFMDAIPVGATGKILKTKLRDQLRDYTLPALRT
jgi:acyl-CoA synthetase (AMP-forming)/AMP-acid ligase II